MLLSHCFPRIRIQTRAARHVVKSVKSLGSRDRSLRLTFHAPALLVPGSAASGSPTFWICLSAASCVTTSEFLPLEGQVAVTGQACRGGQVSNKFSLGCGTSGTSFQQLLWKVNVCVSVLRTFPGLLVN